MHAPAVLLHGFGDSPECWSPLIAAIDDDVAVTTPAAPGHGQEPMPPGAALELGYLAAVATVHVAAAAHRADRPIVLGGHSMGAATAAAVAAANPDLVAGLYLEDPPWSWPPSEEPDPEVAAKTAELAQWIAGLQGSSHEDRVQWCLDHNPGWPRDEYDIWARAKAEVDPAVFAQPIDLGRHAWQPLVQLVRVPATVLVGDWHRGSACMPEVAEHLTGLPGWQVIRLPEAGHDVRREQRAAAIEAFTTLLRDAA
jgi:pimeloyl-ACP methyl ester carboxylesterase